MPSPIVAIPRRMNFGRPQNTRIGPWPKGVNNRYAGNSQGSDTARFLSNVDVLPNGELRQRAPMRIAAIKNVYNDDATIVLNPVGSGSPEGWIIDGVYQDIIVAHSKAQNNQWVTFTRITNGGTLQLIAKYNIRSSNVAIYNGVAYGIVLFNTPTGTAGKVWQVSCANPAAGMTFSTGTLPTAGGTGQAVPGKIEIIRDRAYFYNYVESWGSVGNNVGLVTYSKTGDPFTFSGDPDAGFFTIEGTTGVPFAAVRSITSIRNTIYIFTRSSTWALSLPNSGIPTNGVLSLINERVGATSWGSVATYDNRVFVAGESGIYEIINSTFVDIGYGLGPKYTSLATEDQVNSTNFISLSISENKLWLSVRGTNVNADQRSDFDPPLDPFFIFNLKSRAWSSYNLGAPPGHYGGTYGNYYFGCHKVVQFNAAASGMQMAVSANLPGFGVTSDFIGSGTLLCDSNNGMLYLMTDEDPDLLANRSDIRIWGDLLDVGGTYISIVSTVWTNDWDGSTTETASWKRYYSVTVNMFMPFYISTTNVSPQLTLTLTDHNGNTITNATVTFTTTRGNQYYSIKQYTSLRARHIQYKLTIDSKLAGPISLINLDVLAKIKESIQSAQVGG